ncbi:MAG: BON domain-containing protein [Pirellulales bacterium]
MRIELKLSRVAALVLLALVALDVSAASAQSNSLFGSRGPASIIGTNTTGSNVGLGSTQGAPTFQGLNGNALGTAGGQFGSATGPTGGNIVGRDDSTGRFVGDQRVNQLGQGGNTGRTNRNFANRSRDNRNANARNGQLNDANSGQRNRAAIRPRQRVAFSYTPPTAQSVGAQIGEQLRGISLQYGELSGVDVVVDAEGVATLTGTVAEPEQRRLAELIVRLEPGVRSVRNDLFVNQP